MDKKNVIGLISISALVGAAISFVVSTRLISAVPDATRKPVESSGAVSTNALDCDNINMIREYDSQLVKPLLLVNIGCESKELTPLKTLVVDLIQSMKSEGRLTRAGVYFKELNTTRWISVNDTELFYPGSLLKVALAINILKMSETNHALLDKKLAFNSKVELKITEAPENALSPGNEYTVRELIDAANADSNNDAVTMLLEVFDKKMYEEMFNEIAIPIPDLSDAYYRFSPTDFSKFFRILYNATYLNHSNSEYCMNLLLRSKFDKGMTRDLPSSVRVAHKFGERYTESKLTQFHEAGVVYAGGKPYVVSIMTEGENHDALVDCVARISKLIYDLNSKGVGVPNASDSRIQS
ncbi:MAG: serine hydrolase [Flavobacteriales bacterium]